MTTDPVYLPAGKCQLLISSYVKQVIRPRGVTGVFSAPVTAQVETKTGTVQGFILYHRFRSKCSTSVMI